MCLGPHALSQRFGESPLPGDFHQLIQFQEVKEATFRIQTADLYISSELRLILRVIVVDSQVWVLTLQALGPGVRRV